MAQLMPLPLIVSCFSKIQIGFTFLVPAHPGSPGQRAVKRVCVCVCVCEYLSLFSRLDEKGKTTEQLSCCIIQQLLTVFVLWSATEKITTFLVELFVNFLKSKFSIKS